MFQNPRRGRQARNFTTNGSKILGEAGKQEILQQMFPKILDLKSSSEQIFSKN